MAWLSPIRAADPTPAVQWRRQWQAHCSSSTDQCLIKITGWRDWKTNVALQDKEALPTGASPGIGRTIAEHLGRNGASVVVNYCPTERDDADEVVWSIEKHGGTAVAAAADVADAEQLRGLFDVADEQFGRLVVLNAANVKHGTIVDTSDEQFDAMLAANARGGFVALRESAIRLRGGGRIVETAELVLRETSAVPACS
jgi:3-oxoacyl-[acyl-carrier protein] reductase